jgi:hypothetical protein
MLTGLVVILIDGLSLAIVPLLTVILLLGVVKSRIIFQ